MHLFTTTILLIKHTTIWQILAMVLAAQIPGIWLLPPIFSHLTSSRTKASDSDASDTTRSWARPVDSPTDHSGLVVTIGWQIWSIACILVVMRFVGRGGSSCKTRLEDCLVVGSLFFFVLYQVVMHMTVLHGGLGLSNVTDPRYNVDLVGKLIYTTNLLALSSLSLSRLATIPQLVVIFTLTRTQFWVQRLYIPLFAWSGLALTLLVFPCAPPHPWSPVENICMSTPAVHTAIGLLGLSLDVCLVAIPVHTIARLKVSANERRILQAFFSLRAGMTIIIGCQLWYLWRADRAAFPASPFMDYRAAITSQCIVGWSIVSVCMPYLKPFLNQSGFVAFGDFDTVPQGRGRDRRSRSLGQAERGCGGQYIDGRMELDNQAIPLPALTRFWRRVFEESPSLLTPTPACARMNAQRARAALAFQSRLPPLSTVWYDVNSSRFSFVLERSGQWLGGGIAGSGRTTSACSSTGGAFHVDFDPDRADEELPLVDAADVHGLCNDPDCGLGGSEWPELTAFPVVGRLEVMVTREVEVVRDEQGELVDG